MGNQAVHGRIPPHFPKGLQREEFARARDRLASRQGTHAQAAAGLDAIPPGSPAVLLMCLDPTPLRLFFSYRWDNLVIREWQKGSVLRCETSTGYSPMSSW